MATFPVSDYPGAVDSDIPAPASGDTIGSDWGKGVRNAIIATQLELGANPSGAAADVAARFTALDSDLADVVSDVAALPGGDTRIFDVVTYGALVDGSTNDTAAWQAAIDAAAAAGGGVVTSSLNGVSVISGALQDTGGANAQLLLPAVDYVDTENMTVVIRGITPPANVFSVIGSTPLPDGPLVLKSTLTSGSGGAMIGARGPSGTFGNFTNLTLRLENIAFRMPANPTHTALDLRYVACLDADNVFIDAGNYYVAGISEPTTSTSFALRCPGNDNGAHVRLGQVDVVGFYNGYEFSEHATGWQVTAGACRKAFTFLTSNHASIFHRLQTVHCQRGIVGAGTHYVDVGQFNIEHAASGTWVTVYDVDDASNYLHGSASWHVVLASVGIDATFTKNGGTSFNTSRVGATSGSGSLTVKDEGSTTTAAATTMNFVGAGVTVTDVSGVAVVTIPGGAAYVYRDRLTATTGNNVLTLGATPVANSPLVHVNGAFKDVTADYTISSNVITFGSALTAGDIVSVQYHSAASSASASVLSGGGVNIVDNFTAADSSSSLSSRSTSTGSYAWSVGAGTWGITSNRAYESAGAGQVNYATVNAAVADCTVSATIQAATTTAYYGVCGRMNAATGDGYLVQINHGSSDISISKRTSGSLSVLGSTASYTAVNGDVISLVMSGSSLIAKVNGVTKVTTTDSTYIANTKHGIWTYFNSPRFDDFSVQP